MVFSSNIFLFLFLPIILAFYFIPLEKLGFAKYKNYCLLVASLFFYSWGEACYIWLLGISILGNYIFGICISRKKLQKLTLFLALFFNLALLLYFKYANFLVQNLSLAFELGINENLLPKRLPIGISFFTFHAISYLVDIYREKCRAQKNFLDLALYIAFFPQLIAGPIVRYNTIVKYLQNRRHSIFMATYGVRRFIVGLAKKIIIANPLGEVADAIFSSQLDSINSTIAWIGIACYTMQIYFDFSGYSDMAIGLARIFGFKFPENFNYPYVAKSIKEFWRRWHISLSAWFRDYVYIPLGGNRVSLARQYFNLILVFFLCGLWHGAGWSFVAWGLFHGFFLVFERLKIVHFLLNKLPSFLQHFYAIIIIMIGWVFFRSIDLTHAFGYLNLMFLSDNDVIISGKILNLINSHFVLTVGAVGLIAISPLCRNFVIKFANRGVFYSVIVDVLLLLIFTAAVIKLSSATHNPFIYFQF